jgi:hypothetical protein
VTSWERKYALTTALWIDAYQAIHDENKKQSFFGLFSENALMNRSDDFVKLADSWIGVLRQIRNGNHIP